MLSWLSFSPAGNAIMTAAELHAAYISNRAKSCRVLQSQRGQQISQNFVSRVDKYVVPLLEGDISNAPRSVRNASSLRSLGIAR
jgi:hypothetical protein